MKGMHHFQENLLEYRVNMNQPECVSCPLSGRPHVPPELPEAKGDIIWIVGEAPGFEEVRDRRPFVGKSGRLLRSVIAEAGFFEKFSVLITNACLCHPENNEIPPARAVRACRNNLLELKRHFPPHFIIALGKTASKALGLPDLAMEALRGKVMDTQFGRCLVTYHPSAVLRTRYRLKALFEMDLKKAYLVASGHVQEYHPDIAVLRTTDQVAQALSSLKGNVAFDIETSIPAGKSGGWLEGGIDPLSPDGTIVSMAFASGNEAFVFPLQGEALLKRLIEKERKRFMPQSNGTAQLSLFEDPAHEHSMYSHLSMLLSVFSASIDIDRVKKALQDLFSRDDVALIAHNGKFEIQHMLTRLGLLPRIRHDTMIMAYLLNETAQGFYSLDALVSLYLPFFEGYKKRLLSDNPLLYNAMDAYVTLKLHEKLEREIRLSGAQREHIERAERIIMEHIYPLLVEVELNGVRIDTGKLKEFDIETSRIKQKLLMEVGALTGTSDVRAKRFREAFYSYYEHNPPRTEKGEPSMDSDAMAHVYRTTKSETLKRLAVLKNTLTALDKLETSYIRPYLTLVNPATGRVHPSYRITGTETGRLSCSDPNFQQMPRKGIVICPSCLVSPIQEGEDKCPLCGNRGLREVLNMKESVVPEEGCVFVAADFSQMEVRILAHLSGDPELIRVIREGLDMHSYTASRVFGIPYEEIKANKDKEPYSTLRQRAKSATFGVIYGSTAKGLAAQMGIREEEAQAIIEKFYETFPRVRRWIEEIHEHVTTHGFCFSPAGRIRRFHIPDASALREAQNFPVQSYASDLTLAAAEEMRKRLKGIGGKIVGLVHDSIEMEIPGKNLSQALEIIKECMTTYLETTFSLKVPLKVEIEVGESWAGTKRFEGKADKKT